MPTSNNQLNCILLIDDDQISNFVSQRLIGSLDITRSIITLKHGKECIDFLKKYFEDYKSLSELIFLDINMRIMNAFEFLLRFNLSEFKGKTVVAV